METIKLYCRELHEENGAFVETGNKTVTFTADVPVGVNKGYIRKRFIIHNVGETDKHLDACFYARQFVMFYMCGYLYADKDYEIIQE